MKYRPLGSTGLEVSVLGFGASPLGDVFGVIPPDEGVRAVHCAIDHGINFFDVSPYYGLTLAETRLGKALEGKRDRVILATKCGRYDDRDFDFSAERVAVSVEESLKRLRTDYLDVIQAHDIEFADYRQLIDETLPALRRLQAAGKVRWVGISAFPCDVLCHVASTVKVDTILSYCRYNLLIQDMNERLTPLARCKNIGLINASPLLMGILTEAGPPQWHPAPARTKLVGAKIVELCRRSGVRAADVALRFCLDHDYVATTLVGMATTQQVEENIGASAFEVAPELMQQIRKMVEPVADFTWPSGREVTTP